MNMEYIFGFILELVLEGSIEVSKKKNIPKYIRYPLIFVIVLFFIAVIGLILLVGVLSMKENMLLGIFFILVGLFLLIMSILKFKKIYLEKTNKE